VPLFTKSPVPFTLNVCVAELAVYGWIVPLFRTPPDPVTVSVLAVVLLPIVRLAPELTVKLRTEGLVLRVTVFPAVVAITTSSPVPGITPPNQVPVVFQLPPVVVDVIVPALTVEAPSRATRAIRSVKIGIECVVGFVFILVFVAGTVVVLRFIGIEFLGVAGCSYS
jgi:hypothetical protein